MADPGFVKLSSFSYLERSAGTGILQFHVLFSAPLLAETDFDPSSAYSFCKQTRSNGFHAHCRQIFWIHSCNCSCSPAQPWLADLCSGGGGPEAARGGSGCPSGKGGTVAIDQVLLCEFVQLGFRFGSYLDKLIALQTALPVSGYWQCFHA